MKLFPFLAALVTVAFIPPAAAQVPDIAQRAAVADAALPAIVAAHRQALAQAHTTAPSPALQPALNFDWPALLRRDWAALPASVTNRQPINPAGAGVPLGTLLREPPSVPRGGRP